MQLKRPTLLLDKNKCLENIRKMKNKAEKYGLIFRPHFKTHQSAEIGKWFKNEGIDRIAVSSVSMANYLAQNGWNDIVIAFPLNIAELDEVIALSHQTNLHVVIENMDALTALARKADRKLGVFIKIDAGYHRTGIPVKNHQQILILLHEIGHVRHLVFKGFLVHNGQTYHQPGPEQILEVHDKSHQVLTELKMELTRHNLKSFFSVGDTPAISLTENFENINEIRPGNFVFYDVMQQNLGACTFQDIAVALACPVVAKHEDRMEVIIYGGAVHLSKDYITGENGNKIFGLIARLDEDGWGKPWPDTYVKTLSQEHGIIKTNPDVFRRLKIGDFIAILPIHSCLTTNLMREFTTLDGKKITTMLSCSK